MLGLLPFGLTTFQEASTLSIRSQIVQAVIDKQGNVVDAKVLKGLPMGLDQEALRAIRQWKFEPATLNGKPVDVYYNLTVNFTLQ